MEQHYHTFQTLPQLISAEQVALLVQLTEGGYFQEGTQTASGAAAAVKNNLQLDPNDFQSQQVVEQMVMQALVQRPEVQALHLQAIYPPILSQYTPGMTYGWHTDSPQMANSQRQVQVRTDLAMTLFLAPPESYEGGELEVHGPAGLLRYKLAPGDAILYPASALHRVAPVTQGNRVAVVTWLQSTFANAEQRQIMAQLDGVIKTLQAKDLQSEEAIRLQQVWANLWKQWS